MTVRFIRTMIGTTLTSVPRWSISMRKNISNWMDKVKISKSMLRGSSIGRNIPRYAKCSAHTAIRAYSCKRNSNTQHSNEKRWIAHD